MITTHRVNDVNDPMMRKLNKSFVDFNAMMARVQRIKELKLLMELDTRNAERHQTQLCKLLSTPAILPTNSSPGIPTNVCALNMYCTFDDNLTTDEEVEVEEAEVEEVEAEVEEAEGGGPDEDDEAGDDGGEDTGNAPDDEENDNEAVYASTTRPPVQQQVFQRHHQGSNLGLTRRRRRARGEHVQGRYHRVHHGRS